MPVKLVTQPVGSLGEFAARQLLRAHGLTYADVKGWGGSDTHVRNVERLLEELDGPSVT